MMKKEVGQNTDFTKQFMIDCYDLINSKSFKWPYEFNKIVKRELLETYIQYFEQQDSNEDYLKCAALKKKLELVDRRKKKCQRKK